MSSAPDAARPFHCSDCGVNVAVIGEWYVLRDPLWQEAARDKPAQYLCVGCLEERLGRRLTPDDFNPAAPANITREENAPTHQPLRPDLVLLARAKNDRLRSRIEGTP